MGFLEKLKQARHLPTIAYLSGLGLLALAVTAIWLADTRFLADQHRIGAEVNLAGRQRMLSQRIAMVAQDMPRFERVNGIHAGFTMMGCGYQMLRAHNALLSADLDVINTALGEGIGCRVEVPAKLAKGDLSPPLQAAFFGGDQPLDPLLRRFIYIVADVAVANQPDPEQIDEILRIAYLELPVKLNSLVRVFQDEGEESLHWLDDFITAMWALTLILVILEILFIFRPMARTISRTMDKLQDALAESDRHKADLQEANEQLLEGIHYARKIQEGVLTDADSMRNSVEDAAMLWEPLQVVSGDFVWSNEVDDKVVFFVADCTGHGVPGALLTMVVSSELKKLLDHADVINPERLMLDLDQAVRHRLGQDRPPKDDMMSTSSDDGFEAALAIYDRNGNTLTFVGAGIPLFIQSPDGIKRIAADRHRLGYRSLRRPESFKVHTLAVEPDETFYIATDGATDHIGGEPKRAFGRKRLFDVLEANAYADLETQLTKLKAVLEDYRGSEPARDDYTVLAVTPRSAAGKIQQAAE